MGLPGASTLSAQQPYGRDMSRDYANVDRMRADIGRDQWRLDEAIRCGRSGEAARIARDLARDQRALDYQLRDIRRDRAGARYDRQDRRRDSDRNGWR